MAVAVMEAVTTNHSEDPDKREESPAPGPESIADVAARLDLPEGYRTEIVNGSIVVSPTAGKRHAKIIRQLEEMLWESLPAGYIDLQNVTLSIADSDEQYIPDLVVLPIAGDDDEWLLPGNETLLVVEVTSRSQPTIDRIDKPHGYARAGIPLYLLIDPLEQTTTLFCEPKHGVYQLGSTVPFGDKIELPDPFEVTIDTGMFT